MKTAEQYIPDSMPCCDTWRALIKEIQLDAFKSGARWSASSFVDYSPILSAAIKDIVNNLTELPPNL